MTYRIPPSLDEVDSCLPLEVGRWYVAYTKVRSEVRAQNALREAGLKTYLPQTTVIIRHARKREKVQRPLFPRYLFVELNEAEPQFFKVRACKDIECLVGVTGTPRSIHGRFVYDLQQAEAAGEFDQTNGEPIDDPFRPGDAIRVKVGTKFGGWPGRVLKMTEEGRVKVLLQGMMGKETEKTFSLGDVEAAA